MTEFGVDVNACLRLASDIDGCIWMTSSDCATFVFVRASSGHINVMFRNKTRRNALADSLANVITMSAAVRAVRKARDYRRLLEEPHVK